MSYTKKEFNVKSNNGIHTLNGVVYIPEGQAKGLFQIVHGMREYKGRYEKFMEELAENGYIAFAHDHLGHGYTVNDLSERGFFADKDGWDLLVRDVITFSRAVRKEYGESLPYFVMGHSMGSFITRIACTRGLEPDKAIFMGTGGPAVIQGIGLGFARTVKLFTGKKHVSKLIDILAFGSYNNRFYTKKEEYEPGLWLTSDESIRQKYYKDELCRFKFTISAMCDLLKLVKTANSKSWFKSMPKELPVLLVSGENDPVGNYGEGVIKVRDKLQAQNINVTCKLYRNGRHEILNDSMRDEVISDILGFCVDKTHKI